MISVCGADVPAWTHPAAIFVEKLNSVQRVCPDELCIAYEAACIVRSVGANNKPPKVRPDTNSAAPNSVSAPLPDGGGRQYRICFSNSSRSL